MSERDRRENDVEDDELIRRCRHGDEKAADDLYDRYGCSATHHGRLCWRVRRIIHRVRADISGCDVVVVAFFQALNKYASGKGSFGGFVYRIAVNDAKKAYRKGRTRGPDQPPELEGGVIPIEPKGPKGPTPEDRILARDVIHRAFDTLSPQGREVLRLYHVEGWTEAEIATGLMRSVPWVSKTKTRAEAQLRAYFAAHGVDPADYRHTTTERPSRSFREDGATKNE